MDRYPLEDLVAYQIGTEIKTRINALLAPQMGSRDVTFCSQVKRAAESISSNIAEGHSRYNPAEFANFLRYARASVAELLERLPDGVGRGYYSSSDLEPLLKLLNRESAIISGLRASMLKRAAERRTKARKP